LLLLFFTSIVSVDAIGPPYSYSIIRQYQYILAKHPRYVMDIKIKPNDPIEDGVDCSRLHYLVYKWAAVPGIQRETSSRMALGYGGWTGIDIPYEEILELDFLYFTWKSMPNRINGHVMASFSTGVIQSSTKRGVVLDPWTGSLKNSITRLRRVIK
jgi:hypothetical protein